MAINLADKLTAKTTEGIIADSKEVFYDDAMGSASSGNTVAAKISELDWNDVKMEELEIPESGETTTVIDADFSTVAMKDGNGNILSEMSTLAIGSVQHQDASETVRDIDASYQEIFNANEASRQATFNSKEATRDAANQAALDAADTLSGLTEDVADLSQKVGKISGDVETLSGTVESHEEKLTELESKVASSADALEAAGDLDITDEEGNAVVRFKGGDIRTKNFNSRAVPTQADYEETDADLLLSDDKGNVIAEFKGGNLRTQYFDSSSITSDALHLRILVLGNSYSLDSFMYLPFIIKEYNITCTIGIYFRSGGLLSQLDSEFNSASNSFYYIDTRVDEYWKDLGTKTPEGCVMFENWDIISLQQGSVDSPYYERYNPYTRNIMRKILDCIRRPIKFAWNININRKSSEESSVAQSMILESIKQVCEKEAVDIIFPYGTAIFNARTDAALNSLSDGGELWASDNIHLQEGLPCYIAALANTQALFNAFYPNLSVMGDTTRVTSSLTSKWQVKNAQGPVITATEDSYFKAQIAAINANKNNFKITSL